MEERHLKRLHEEQELAVTQTKDKIQTLQKFKDDYRSLQSRLDTLPHKITHNIMVPFGKKAFMPGQIVHTNEILVLLGDNWFADRSAKQACEIVDRRVEVLDKQIAELQKQLDLLTPRLDFTLELQGIAGQKGDVIEINEEYDAEKERLWRERHKENVRKYNQQLREEQRAAILKEEKKEKERKEHKKRKAEAKSDTELWARLEELEMQEDDQGELDVSSSEASSSGEESGESDESHEPEEETNTKVKWKDESQHARPRSANVIRFSHTSIQEQVTEMEDTHKASQTVTSPADIYQKYAAKNEPKSILKQTTSQIRPKSTEDRERLPETASAFSGTVVEKTVQGLAAAEMHESLQSNQETDKSHVPKKVSKFKAQRMQSKR